MGSQEVRTVGLSLTSSLAALLPTPQVLACEKGLGQISRSTYPWRMSGMLMTSVGEF